MSTNYICGQKKELKTMNKQDCREFIEIAVKKQWVREVKRKR